MRGLAIIFARVSLLLVNFGFWVGSLWGDYPGESWEVGGKDPWTAREAWEKTALHVSDWVFMLGWAALAIGVGIWAARANRRWVVTAAASFAAINFYTQWFERLGAQPWAIIVVGIAVALWRYNTAHAGHPAPLGAGV